jgi:hypothetical protein
MARSTTLLGALGSVLLLVGCDPWAVAGDARSDAAAEAKKPHPDDFVVCMAACAEGDKLSVDDRATCRAACEAKTGRASASADSTVAKSVLLRFDTCIEGCAEARPGSDDLATCRLVCAQQAASEAKAAGFDDVQRGCAASCLDALGGCEGACGTGSDDNSTCRLHCESEANRCLARCQAPPEPES